MRQQMVSWLSNTHAMEMQAIQILENQARRIESYPELQTRILEHLEETRGQSLVGAAEELGDAETAGICTGILREEEAMAGWLEQRLPDLSREFLRRQRAGQQAKR